MYRESTLCCQAHTITSGLSEADFVVSLLADTTAAVTQSEASLVLLYRIQLVLGEGRASCRRSNGVQVLIGTRQRILVSMGKLAGIEVAEWIPSGSWKDVLIGNYDYSYLFIVRSSLGGHKKHN